MVVNCAALTCGSARAAVPSSAYGGTGGYSYNWVYFGNFTHPQPMINVAFPSETILLVDGNNYYCAGGSGGPATTWAAYVISPHNGQTNLLWVDGHVKSMVPQYFLDDSRNSNRTSGQYGTNPSPANPSRTSYWDMD